MQISRNQKSARSNFDSDASIDDITAALRRDGAVIVRDLVSTDLMDEVYAEVIENSSEADRDTTGPKYGPKEIERLVVFRL